MSKRQHKPLEVTPVSTRTDIHRPSVILPKDYHFVAYEYLGPDRSEINWNRQVIHEHMARTGGHYSQHDHGGNCHVCGAHCIYTALFHHIPSNVYVRTGLDCAAKMELDEGEGERFRQKVHAALEARAGKRKAQAFLENVGLARCWAIYTEPYTSDNPAARPIGIVRDIVSKLVQYGSLSEKQVDFLRKLLGQIDIAPAKQAEIAAEKAKSQHVGNIGERHVATLTATHTFSYESQWGGGRITIFRDENGNSLKTFGQCPIDKDETAKCKFSVKAHEDYKGEKQTLINRLAIVKEKV